MEHDKYRKLMQLVLAEEIGDDDLRRLESHLGECESCRAEFDELKGVLELVAGRPVEPSERMLLQAREKLERALAKEPPLGSLLSRVRSGGAAPSAKLREARDGRQRDWFGWLHGFRIPLAGAATLSVGFFIGYLAFGGAPGPVFEPSATQVPDEAAVLGAPDYNNIRFIDSDTRDGQVEIQYDLVRPVRLRASLDDERMQRMLAFALRSEENDGVRLRTLEVLNAGSTIGSEPAPSYDEDIKQSLLVALKSDPNAGVRKQALYVLGQMPFDESIKEACLYVLTSDDNAGLRVGAINLLAGATLDGYVAGSEVYDVLKSELDKEDEQYLRVRTSAFIEEVNNNEVE